MLTAFDSTSQSYSIGNGLKNLQIILNSGALSVFYCYYAVVDPTGFLSSAIDPFSFGTIAWNLLYSIGFFYTDTYNVITNLQSPGVNAWANLGTAAGDILIRPFYSHFLDQYTNQNTTIKAPF
jgi:hypothetical protein